MKLEIEEFNQGYVVKYIEDKKESIYIYKNTEELKMIQDVTKRFLRLSIKAVIQ